jgi:photosystem II stability/assembly factor-like uncharacterized protein
VPWAAGAQQVNASLFAGMRWRLIGPYRGGRTVAAVGVHGRPTTLYIGVNNGGVWKSTDFGRVWQPIFDDQPTGSIGAIAVAPSDPNTIYVGTGEGLQRPDLSTGDGVYKSTDGGATWRNMGLADGQQIAQIVVDPTDANRLFVAVIGHPYGANDTRGIFRSTDGGATWSKVLYKDANTGGMDVVLDPANPQTVFAVLWSARQAPWEIGSSWTISANNGLFKSTDGGTTWRQITSGLPTAAEGLGRIGLAVCQGTPSRMYAVIGANTGGGLYRSDDGGESWRLADADPRLWGRDGDFNEVKVDPTNPDVVYVANVVTWKSSDGGKTFTGWRGAPGGDDYHRLWIDPQDPAVILLVADQGAIVTVNGGATWSSWYNQPTAQFYHVTTDNRFPYWVYGGQQESGSAGVASRGNDGQITFREWHPVGAEEYGYIAPDPLHPNVVFGGRVQRFDWTTGDVQDVTPEAVRSGTYRYVRTLPLLFSPVDPHVLYFGTNVLWATVDGGRSWRTLSPDLTRDSAGVPANLGDFTSLDPEHGAHRGVIYTIAPSFRRLGLLWVGTDDGLIHVTHDGGGSWKNVTPAALTPWSKVSVMEASHYDTLEAFAAVNRFRLDDLHPHIYRTRDGGRSWTEIVTGIPDGEVVDAVREDPVRRGLLFAGTERTVYVSFDDGDHWQSLRLNLPPSSVRDLAIHGTDLIAGTHGRSFWILDDITPLRQIDPRSAGATMLYRPAPAVRVRWNRNTDTPLPPDEPAAANPPDGASIDYYIAAAAGPVTLEILDSAGGLVRRFASTDTAEAVDSTVNIPLYWIRPFRPLSSGPGAHRFVWDLRYAPPDTRRDYPIAAVSGETPREPRGPWVVPGRYTVQLTVGGRANRAPLLVTMDPRVPTSSAGLARQLALAQRVVTALHRSSEAQQQVHALRTRLAAIRASAGSGLQAAVDSLDHAAAALESGPRPRDAARGASSFARLAGDGAAVYDVLEGTDQAPTTQAVAAVTRIELGLAATMARWRALQQGAVVDLDARLRRAGVPSLKQE